MIWEIPELPLWIIGGLGSVAAFATVARPREFSSGIGACFASCMAAHFGAVPVSKWIAPLIGGVHDDWLEFSAFLIGVFGIPLAAAITQQINKGPKNGTGV